MNELINQVVQTYKTDETGDANLFEFLIEQEPERLVGMTVEQFLREFLVWANG